VGNEATRSHSARISRNRRGGRNARGAAEQNVERSSAQYSHVVTVPATDRFANGEFAGSGKT